MKKIAFLFLIVFLLLVNIGNTQVISGGGGGSGTGDMAASTYDTGSDGAVDKAESVKSPATTGVITVTGPGAGTTRVKTVRDANDTILELGGSYTPTGTWNWTSATWSNVPTLNQNTTGTSDGSWGGTGADRLASSFTTTGAFTLCRLQFEMYRNDTCTGSVTATIRADNAGTPSTGAAVCTSTTTITASTISTSATFYDFDFTGCSLSATTKYWASADMASACTEGQSMQVRWGTNGSDNNYYWTGEAWAGLAGTSTYNFRTQN
jgi:hypothetical protein